LQDRAFLEEDDNLLNEAAAEAEAQGKRADCFSDDSSIHSSELDGFDRDLLENCGEPEPLEDADWAADWAAACTLLKID
jgi:hypothetical protein